MRPAVARTVFTLAAFGALATAGILAACGSFDSTPAPTNDAGEVMPVPDGGNEATVADAGSDAETCEVLFENDFTTLGAFEPQSNDAGPAVLAMDGAHAVKPPSLAAVGKLARGTGYLNSSAARDIKLPASLEAGQRLELEYDLFIEDPVDSYGEVGCTLQLFDPQDARTRLLLGLSVTGTIEATFDPAATGLKSVSKAVVADRKAGDYRVKTTLAAVTASTANVRYVIRTGTEDFTDVPIPAGIDRLRLVCGIDYAFTDASAPVTLRVWVDDVVVRRCVPKQ